MPDAGLTGLTTGGKMLCLGPQVVALIIFLPGHFCLWNLFVKWKVIVIVDIRGTLQHSNFFANEQHELQLI